MNTPESTGMGGWTPEDEECLRLLERSPGGAIAAAHIRIAIAQAHEQYRRAKADREAFRVRRRLDELEFWGRFGWLPDSDATFLSSVGIRSREAES